MTVYGMDSRRRMWTAPSATAPARAGRVGAAQVVAAELIAMLLLAAVLLPYGSPLPLGLAALLAPAVLRWRGRWWYEVAQARLRLGRPEQPPSVHALAGEGEAGGGEAGGGVGIGQDADGWFAAMAVAPEGAGAQGSAARAPRLDTLVRFTDDRMSLQVLVHHPAAAPGVDAASPCVRSSQELRGALGVAAPAGVWIVLRGRSRAAGAGELDVGRRLRGALARIAASLQTRGFRARVLDGPELESVLRRSRVGPDQARTPAATAHESWRRWQTGRLAHVSFGATRWPARVPPDLLADLGRVGDGIEGWTSMTVSGIQAPDRQRGPTGARLVVRIVAPVDQLAHATRRLRAHARALGVSLVRLDGEHGPAVYATAPTAAPYGWGRPW